MKTLLSVLTLLFLFSCSTKQAPVSSPPPPSLPVERVISQSQTTYQEYPASIEGKLNIEVRPQVGGTLDRVYVDEGTFVKQGQRLFKINESPFRAQLNNSIASLHAAEGALANTELEIEKLKPLVSNKVISDYQLKTATAARDVAKANVEQARASIATAQINLGYTLIKAPVSGYISRLQKKQGSLVSTSDVQPLTQLSDVHEVHVYFSLGEKDFVSFKEQYAGQTLKEKLKKLKSVSLLLSDNSVYEKTGRIDMIDGQFDKNTGAITLRASFPNPDGMLRSGNTGKIRLSLDHNQALIVPQSATIEMQEKTFVYTLSDSNKVKRQPIEISGKVDSNYLVNKGLKVGDRIVLSGIDHLQEGMLIHPEPSANRSAKN